MLERILLSLVKKEKLIGVILSFLLGAATSALGINLDLVKQEICEGVTTSQNVDMAKLKISVAYDSKVEAFGQPQFTRSTGEAFRIWETVSNDGQSMMAKHPADYTLFEIGEYDDKTGQVEMYATHKNLGTALEAKKPDDINQPLPFLKNEKKVNS